MQLAEGVIELLEAGKPLTKENLDAAYVARRRASWVEAEGRVAEKARDGFQQRRRHRPRSGWRSPALTKGKLSLGERAAAPGRADRARSRSSTRARSRAEEIARDPRGVRGEGRPAATTRSWTRAGWPAVPLDGKLLVTHQDALLMGGKVQAPPGYADHVVFLQPRALPGAAARQVCIEICSAEAIAAGRRRRPEPSTARSASTAARACGAARSALDGTDEVNMTFRAGAGGLHSAEN